MRQFVLPADWDGSPELRIGGREARHLIRVLRLGPGDRFPAIDAAGRAYACEIRSVDADSLRVEVGKSPSPASDKALPDLRAGPWGGGGAKRGQEAASAPSQDSSPPPGRTSEGPGRPLPRIILAAALLKGEKFDLVIRQASETGVARIIPLVTARSLGAPAGAARLERQRRILREALQQSGSSVPTSLEEATDLRELPDRLGPPDSVRVSLLLHETPLVEASLHGYLGPRPDEIVVCVGPEGGFSEEELRFLLGAGFLPLHLPGAVLRAETAALYAIAAIKIVASEHDSWIRAQA